MEKIDQLCVFTGSESKSIQVQRISYQIQFTGSICGDYTLTNSVYEKLKGEINQGHLNCAQQNFKIFKNNSNSMILWVLRNQYQVEKENLDVWKKKDSKYDGWEISVLEDFVEHPIDHSNKPHKLLESFGSRLVYAKAFSMFFVLPLDYVFVAIVDDDEMVRVMNHLHKEGLIEVENAPSPDAWRGMAHWVKKAQIRMTAKGWEMLGKRSGVNGNRVFIATAFAWDNDFPCRREEATDAIKRACRELGYVADIVSDEHTGNITDRVMAEIRGARFVVCELTYNNRGAYFESGFARGLGKEVFHVVHTEFAQTDQVYDASGKKIHFDLQQTIHRKWTTVIDLESQLKDWIGANMGRFGA